VAAALARKVSTPNTRAVIVGAGDVATGLVRVLSKSAFSEITIVNRTLATALDLADRWGATALPLEKLSEALSTADVVITSTASRHPIISDDMVRLSLKDRSTRRDRLITIIDLGMPRDVDPEVRLIDGVKLYDLDDLRLVTGELTEERTQAIPLVETIIFEEVDRFRQWFDGLAVAPLISDLRRKAEQIRISATSDALRQLPHIDPETRRQFEHLSRTLVNRILHDPTTRLRAAATTGVVGGKAEAIQHLFDLPARSKPNLEDRQ